MAFHDESQVYQLFFFEKVHISANASVEFQIWLGNDVGLENNAPLNLEVIARTYLQPHYGNGAFGNVYLSAGQH